MNFEITIEDAAVALTRPLKLKGVPGSPYTRKMLAYLRFRHIPYELMIGDQTAALDLPEAKVVSDRQISRLYVVGSNDITAPVIEASYRRFLSLMDLLIEKQKFVLGTRPSSADFGIYAQLTQLARFDPTPTAICLNEAPRVYAWTDLVDDLSGQPANDDDWMSVDDARAVLGELLTEIGRTYAPALLANADALQKGDEQMETTIDGQRWVQPAFPYQAKCLQWINAEYQELDKFARALVDGMLSGTGCDRIILKV